MQDMGYDISPLIPLLQHLHEYPHLVWYRLELAALDTGKFRWRHAETLGSVAKRYTVALSGCA